MWSAAASCRFSRIAAVNPKLKLFDDQQTSFLESINYKMQISSVFYFDIDPTWMGG